MKSLWSKFARLQLLLLIGGNCEAFLGGHIHKSQPRTLPLPVETSGTTTALFYSQNPSSTNSSLLQGKVLVLQDVVKEMDARHKELVEQSNKAKEEYHQRLETLERDLEVSKTSKDDDQSAISKLESALEETIEKHAMDLEKMLQTKDQEREQETEKIRKEFEEQVQNLEENLNVKYLEVEDLVAKMQNVATETENTEKDAMIGELKKQIQAQKEQLDSATKEKTQEEKAETSTDESESLAIETLKAEHQETVQDYKSQIDALTKEKTKLSSELVQMDESYKGKLDYFCDGRNQKLSELEAKHQWVVEDYETRLDALFAEKEELSKDLQTQHDEIIADYETKLGEALANNDKLSAQLTTMQTTCEEQVEIAEASVQAGKAREAEIQGEAAVLSKRVQIYWIAAKLTNVLAKRTEQEFAALWKERDGLERENEELYEELETTKKGVQDLIEQLENQNTLWQKLRSKVTGK